jgi:Flp pilus assembly protein TadG
MRGILTFLRDDRGSQTIEFVLWLPIIGALLVIISYASILYTTHTEMWNVARDTARRMTTGLFDVDKVLDEAAAEEYAQSQLKLYEFFGSGYEVVATEDPEQETMTVVITLGVSDSSFDAGFFGAFALVGGTMAARVVMRAEPT